MSDGFGYVSIPCQQCQIFGANPKKEALGNGRRGFRISDQIVNNRITPYPLLAVSNFRENLFSDSAHGRNAFYFILGEFWASKNAAGHFLIRISHHDRADFPRSEQCVPNLLPHRKGRELFDQLRLARFAIDGESFERKVVERNCGLERQYRILVVRTCRFNRRFDYIFLLLASKEFEIYFRHYPPGFRSRSRVFLYVLENCGKLEDANSIIEDSFQQVLLNRQCQFLDNFSGCG